MVYEPTLPEPRIPAGGEIQSSGSTWRIALSVFTDNRLAVIGVGIVLFFVLFSWVGPFVYHTNQIQTNLFIENQGPSLKHVLGTDTVGYDLLGRLMLGGQTSLEIGVAAAIFATGLGVLWGSVAGFVGGVVDDVMMRIVDAVMAIPPLFLMLLLATIFRPSVGLLIIVIAIVSWLAPARLVRGEVLSLRELEYVQAVKVMGGSGRRILLRHIIPNVAGTIMVNATFQVADAILLVATLSFLGLGIPPPAANWGGMLASAQDYIFAGYWWQIWPAGICIVATVVAFNFIGDAARDALDVRLRQR